MERKGLSNVVIQYLLPGTKKPKKGSHDRRFFAGQQLPTSTTTAITMRRIGGQRQRKQEE